MSERIEVRPARAEDKEAIVAFCQDTFEWGDYIPRVWESWLVGPQDKLYVAVVGGRPVGLLHLALLEDRVAWLEGMRVHPDFRRMGVGTAMDTVVRAQASRLGCRIAHLVTAVNNLAAQKTLPTQGYQFLTRFNNWSAPSSGLDLTPFPVAVSSDLPAILKLWDRSEQKEASHGLVPTADWKWTGLSDQRLRAHIDAGEIRVAPRGFAILHPFEDEDESGLELLAICGDEETAGVLALGARTEADYRGFPKVEGMLPDDDRLSKVLSNAGYLREGGELVYEQAL